MKVKYIILVVFVSFIFSCKNQKTQQTDESVNQAVCIWDNAALWKEASVSSKWLSSIALGEAVELLNETKIDSSDNNKEFFKVKLSDGKVGWVYSYLIVPDGKPSAIIEKTTIYKRPDLLTATDKSFNKMEMVVIMNGSEDWIEVTNDQKKKSGWIKKSSVTDSTVDVSVAILATKALNEKEHKTRMKKLNEIIANSDLQSSIFIDELADKIDPFEVKEIIQVSTIQEFFNAIGPNRKVEILTDYLKLNTYKDTGNNYVSYKYEELIINEVKNLIIAGVSSEPTRIITTNMEGYVLSIIGSENISLKNLTIGHEPRGEGCWAGVIYLSSCTNLYINNSILFGSGTIGLYLEDVKKLKFKNSTIKECSEGILNAENCNNLEFTFSKFYKNIGYNLFYISQSSSILIDECEIYSNESYYQGYESDNSLFYIDDYTSMTVQNSYIYENSISNYKAGAGSLEEFYVESYGNGWDAEDSDEYYEGDGYDEGYEEDYYEEEGGY